ncbi:efflux RND transporter periplasmic adaptor subunit [Granulicella sp. dw_53]|uniref:efflux RND transporter periplasmic adaptor subunit n=1 Tax=Granulicella sp. dw_53 TaxID=2719792 RepID=UPI001BD49A2D|nr:efflux RND transporter periplasmic adaptor subunit [Granulicella sp. dw_53]
MSNDPGQRSPNDHPESIRSATTNNGSGRAHEGGSSAAPPKRSRGRMILIQLILVAVVALLVVSGIVPRLRSRKALAAETNDLAAPTVLVVQPKRGAPSQEIQLPGNIQAFVDAPIYARTNGYIKHWYFDIGTHVKQGQLLAEIESPEVDQQLSQAEADLGTALANAHLSTITANRFSDLIKQDAVSQQDTDNALNDLAARNTAVKSAQANVDRLKQLVGFEKVYAPFDGVVTARNTDIGQLIDSGSSGGQTRSLFQMAALNKLRVFISVPQIYSQAASPGLTADLTFAEFPGRRFQGKLVRTANAIDPTSRTLNVEVDVDNSKGELFPGAYTEVHLKLKESVPTITVPVSALLFRQEGLRVAIAKSDNTAALVPVTMGRDFGDFTEIATGLTGQERIIANPPDSIIDGEHLDVRTENQKAAAAVPKVAGK